MTFTVNAEMTEFHTGQSWGLVIIWEIPHWNRNAQWHGTEKDTHKWKSIKLGWLKISRARTYTERPSAVHSRWRTYCCCSIHLHWFARGCSRGRRESVHSVGVPLLFCHLGIPVKMPAGLTITRNITGHPTCTWQKLVEHWYLLR